MIRCMKQLGWVGAFACLLAGSSWAGKYNEVLDIGAAAPTWTDLPRAGGGQASLSDYDDREVLVVVFTCNSCPVALAYESRLRALADKYLERGVGLVAIHVHKAESLDAATEHAKEAGFNFDYLHDESQETSKAYGATTTPHIFVLDKDRHVVYMGAMDDNMTPDDVTRHYVEDAIDATLAGTRPPVEETRQFGCGIKWK